MTSYHTIPTELLAGAGTGQFSTCPDVGGGVGGVGVGGGGVGCGK